MTCACIAIAVERIITVYKQILEIRKLRSELARQKVPEETLDGISKHADEVMNLAIEKMTAELIEEYRKDREENRSNELHNALSISLKKIAMRIDRGFNVEVRMAQIQEVSDGVADQKAAADAKESHDRIAQAATTLQFLKLEGDPILKLVSEEKEGESNGASVLDKSESA